MISSPSVADAIPASLLDPPLALSAPELRRLWECDAIRFICRRPPDFEAYPELAVRIRGAFGRALHAQPEWHDRRGRGLGRAYDLLFEGDRRSPGGEEIGKPFVVRAWVEADHLVVELRLIGIASVMKHQAISAMQSALSGGIALRGGQSRYVPLELLDVWTNSQSPAVSVAPVRSASLVFQAPVAVRHRHRHVADGLSIVRSTIRRVRSLSRWQGALLLEDAGAIKVSLEALKLDDRDMFAYRWERYSQRVGNKPIPVMGQLGTLRVTGLLEPLVDYLLIAESCNTGSHAALGLGWFELALYA